ncbi:MAG: hypothetical protein WAX69_06910 [Victivallales bacterium]
MTDLEKVVGAIEVLWAIKLRDGHPDMPLKSIERQLRYSLDLIDKINFKRMSISETIFKSLLVILPKPNMKR